jgi:hypothetical protein
MFTDGLIGASLNIPFDHERVRDEILSCREFWITARPRARGSLMQEGLDGLMPFMSASREEYEQKIAQGEAAAARRVYLKDYDGLSAQSFLVTKSVDHSRWKWSDMAKERCPHTIEIVEQLPFKQIGAVASIIFENTFLPVHRDYMPEQGADRTKSLGLALVPVTGGIGTQIWHPTEKKVYEIKGHSTLFDDAMYHGTAFAPMRIIIRVFGEMDWDVLQTHIVQDSAVYL